MAFRAGSPHVKPPPKPTNISQASMNGPLLSGPKPPKAKARPKAKPAKSPNLGIQARVPAPQLPGVEIRVKNNRADLVYQGSNTKVSKQDIHAHFHNQAQTVAGPRFQQTGKFTNGVDFSSPQSAKRTGKIMAQRALAAQLNEQRQTQLDLGNDPQLVKDVMSSPNYNTAQAAINAGDIFGIQGIARNLAKGIGQASVPSLLAAGGGAAMAITPGGRAGKALESVGRVANVISDGLKAGHTAEDVLTMGHAAAADSLKAERAAVVKSAQQGKNKNRIIFERGSSTPMQSVVGDVRGPKSRGDITGVSLLPHLQTLTDKITQKAIDEGRLGNVVAKLNVGNLVKSRQKFINQLERSAPSALKGNPLEDHERQALFMIAENTPPSILSKFFDRAIVEAGGNTRKVKDLTAQKALLEKSAALVKTEGGRVVLHDSAPRQVKQMLDWMQKSDAKRIQQGTTLGSINPDTAVERLNAPGRVMRGARWAGNPANPTPEGLQRQRTLVDSLQSRLNASIEADKKKVAGGSLPNQPVGGGSTLTRNLRGALSTNEDRLTSMEKATQTRVAQPSGLVGAEDFTNPHGIYVPGQQNESLRGIGRAKFGDVISNRVNKPVGLRGQYKGENLLAGRQDVNAPKLVGEAGLSMQGYFNKVTGLHHLQDISQSVDALPADLKHFQLVKLHDLTHNENVDLNNALAALKAEKAPSRQGMRAVNKAFGGILDRFMPDSAVVDLLNESHNYGAVWKPLTGERSVEAGISNAEHYLFSMPSNALKTAIVYTKLPGHIPARRFSNGFFNLAQMGYRLLPISRKQLIFNKLYPDWSEFMLHMTGKGSLQSIATSKVQKVLVGVVQKWADDNARKMAVYHELEQAAGKWLNPHEAAAYLKQLSEAPAGSKLGHAYIDVGQRATVHAGDYSRRSGFEKRVLSKLFFLWAWHRTAAVTTAKFALEYPLQAGGVGYGTYYLNEKVNAGQPPWDKFNIPLDWVPGAHYLGLANKVSNITTSYPPSQVDADLRALFNIGTPAFGQTIGGELNPYLTTLVATSTGRNLATGQAFKSRLGAVESLSATIPPIALGWGKHSLQDRIVKYIIGTEGPQSAPASPVTIQSSLNTLVKQGSMSFAGSQKVLARLNALKKSLPGIEAKVKKGLDMAVAAGRITAKQEKTKLSSISRREKYVESAYAKAAKAVTK